MEVEVIDEGSEPRSLVSQKPSRDDGFTPIRRKEKKPRRKKKLVNVQQSDRAGSRPKERRNDAIRIKAKDETTYAEILSRMRASVKPETTETEVVSLRRSKQNDVLVILKKGAKTEQFSQQLKEALLDKADVTALDYDLKVQVDIRDIQEETAGGQIKRVRAISAVVTTIK